MMYSQVLLGHAAIFASAFAFVATAIVIRNTVALLCEQIASRAVRRRPCAGPERIGTSWNAGRLSIAARAVRLCGGLALTASAAQLVAGEADRWTSFHRNGNTSLAATELPETWSPQQGVDWRIELEGYGQSAPVLRDGVLFLTSIAGAEKETCLVAAYDAASGQLRWRREFPATVKVKTGVMVSRAAPSPAVDDRALYAMFESGDLFALTHDGELLWKKSFFDTAEHAFQNGHGFGSSPAQSGDSLFLLVDHRGPSYLAALDKSGGRIRWKSERTSRSSWTSPHVAVLGGREQVVVSSGGTVDGYDATDGAQLWSRSGVAGNTIPSVTISGNRILVGASEARRDAAATADELSNFCIEIAAGPDGRPAERLLWAADKAVCYYISPLVHREHAYYVNNQGVLRCVRLADGVQEYEVRMGEPCWAQPIAAGDRLYFFGKTGVTKVIRAGAEYAVIAENRWWTEDNPPLPKQPAAPAAGEGPVPAAAPSAEYLDPIVYGVIACENAFYARTGSHLLRASGGKGKAER